MRDLLLAFVIRFQQSEETFFYVELVTFIENDQTIILPSCVSCTYSTILSLSLPSVRALCCTQRSRHAESLGSSKTTPTGDGTQEKVQG